MTSTDFVVLDIETRAQQALLEDPSYFAEIAEELDAPSNWKDPVKIAAERDRKLAVHKAKMALSAATGTVVVVGLRRGEDVQMFGIDEFAGSEGGLLVEALNWLSDNPVPLVGFNIRRFDLPFLHARCAVHNFIAGTCLPAIKDYDRVRDLCDVLHEGNLNCWRRAFGLPRCDVDGAATLELPIPDLVEKCRKDLADTHHMASRLMPAFRTRGR